MCVRTCRKRSAGLLCFSSPPRLSPSLPTARRRAMNHNHADSRFELERPVQPPARQMHLMTGGALVRLQHATVTTTSGHRRLAGGPSADVSGARGSGVELSLVTWRKGQSKVSRLFFSFFESMISCRLTLSPRRLSRSSVTYDMKAVGMKESAPQTLCVHHNKLHQQ